MGYIVLPQAVRNILPCPWQTSFITLIKETAIIGNIAVLDITKAAQNIGGSNYDILTPLVIGGHLSDRCRCINKTSCNV